MKEGCIVSVSGWEKVKEDVLYGCRRYCAYCETYKGRDIEVHHIVPKADGGRDAFENAIPLCYDCHSEIGSYNPKHPKGNKFKPNELKRIRDNFYSKVEKLPRKPNNISDGDKELLQVFKGDYTNILEYCIETDFTAELVNANLTEEICSLNAHWLKKSNVFQDANLDRLKVEIIDKLEELSEYVSPTYLRLHEGSGKLIFRNSNPEEGDALRDDFRPNSIRIRKDLKGLLETLHSW